MTVDVAESLCVSWLRHVKGCQIVETNWKISHEWDIQNLEKIKDLQQKIKTSFPKNSEIFKQGKNKEFNVTNFMSIGETDVIGVKIQGDKIEKYYGIDVAFHKNGLGYGDTNENITRILKKSIRTIMLFYGYFGAGKNVDIKFATPITKSEKEYTYLEDQIEKLNKILEGEYPFKNYKIEIIAEEDFKTKILGPVMMLSDVINDQSELFARSVQLQDYLFNYDKGNYNKLKTQVFKEIIKNALEKVDVGTLKDPYMKYMLSVIKDQKDKTYYDIGNEIIKTDDKIKLIEWILLSFEIEEQYNKESILKIFEIENKNNKRKNKNTIKLINKDLKNKLKEYVLRTLIKNDLI